MTPIFRTPAALLEEWRRFCDDIVQSGYTAAPTDTAFIRAVAARHGCREATVAAACERHAPAVQDAIDRIRADILTQGALAGKYPATVSTFVLKNKCGWVDKPSAAAPAPNADIAGIAATIERMMMSEKV